MIYFDAHVHIHQRFPLDKFLQNSLRNFERQQNKANDSSTAIYVLLLTESKEADFFLQLRRQAEQPGALLPAAWTVTLTEERESLILEHTDWPDKRLMIFSGRQIVTSERLEVLALAAAEKVPDGLTIEQAIAAVHKQNGIAVLPWGAGKWLGGRGKIITRLVEGAQQGKLFVGDNGGRPVFWSAPNQFSMAAAKNIALLPGSDPLPLAGEEERVASYGAKVDGLLSESTPAADFRELICRHDAKIEPFGKRLGPVRFFKTQISLRLP